MKRAAALAALAVACGAAPERCPPRPDPVGGWAQCISNECGLSSMRFSDLGCTQTSPLSQWDGGSCAYMAAYRCGNGLELLVAYIDGQAFFEIRGDVCVTSYVLSAEPVECVTGMD